MKFRLNLFKGLWGVLAKPPSVTPLLCCSVSKDLVNQEKKAIALLFSHILDKDMGCFDYAEHENSANST